MHWPARMPQHGVLELDFVPCEHRGMAVQLHTLNPKP
jgi:hypothetical protein